MNQRVVSILGALLCSGILLLVALFGYSRYKAAKMSDAAFGAKLQSQGLTSETGVAVRMPPTLDPNRPRPTGEPSVAFPGVSPAGDNH